MTAKYKSTRGDCAEVSFSRAVAQGLAPDGGLYLPVQLPDLSSCLDQWQKLDYSELFYSFMAHFADDLAPDTLRQCVGDACASFEHPQTAPLVRLDDNLHVLELFHGPTLAFKDFALQLLGNLYAEQVRQSGESINVLGATSGDTGSAAIHGLLGKQGARCFILYPEGRISPLQERQMTTTADPDIFPLAISGSFDDAQAIVKELLGDAPIKQRYNLSAINSINLSRILAQCVYYFWAWLKLPPALRERVEFVVPTGNFGNILAGWLAARMGLPVCRFRVATNQNDILHRLFTVGRYEVGPVKPSLAPSMDIQVASNFERFLYYQCGEDPLHVRRIMTLLKEKGCHQFDGFVTGDMRASRADDGDIQQLIREVYEKFGYLVDPHTACAFKDRDPDLVSVVLATAHPAKFPDAIKSACGIYPTVPALDKLKDLPVTKYPLPAKTSAVADFIAEHTPG